MRSFGVLLLLLFLTCSGCAVDRARSGATHIVQPGQTLYRIAKTYQVSVDKIVARNRLKNPTQIKVGQALIIPGVSHTRTVAVVPTEKKNSSAVAKKVNQSAIKKTPQKVSSKKTVPVTRKVQGTSSGNLQNKFLWPVQGKVVKSFNLTATVPSKGIDISANIGSVVVSAAAGKVIYSGNGITGFGHVVIVEHDNALYSVYGYNSKLLVSSGSYVSAGQKIALVGKPTHSNNGLLHFEVWQHKKAVDPAFYLK